MEKTGMIKGGFFRTIEGIDMIEGIEGIDWFQGFRVSEFQGFRVADKTNHHSLNFINPKPETSNQKPETRNQKSVTSNQ